MSTFELQIKKWVDVDNKLAIANANIKELRQERGAVEKQILTHVETNRLQNATVGISDGRLRFVTTKETAPLTLKYVDQCLRKVLGASTMVETIMEEIRDSRAVKEAPNIKRVYNK